MKNNPLLLYPILMQIFFSIGIVRAQDYYPLEIGNQWFYEYYNYDPNCFPSPNDVYGDTMSVTVLKDTIIADKLYFTLDNRDIFGGRIIRTDLNNIYYYDKTDGCDVLFFKLNANITEHWTAQFGGKNYNISLIAVDTTEYFGVPTAILKFQIGEYPWHYMELSKEFGPVEYYYMPAILIKRNIIGCKLSNNYYGYVTSVSYYSKKPYKMNIFQNYPNPFNSNTTIKYSLSMPSKVLLQVMNSLGERVAILEDGRQSAGNHEVFWESKDLPSGVYYYQFKSQHFNLTRKMVLIK